VSVAREFADKIVVVTGGSRGIGRSVAVAFAREGAQTVIVGSSEANLKSAAQTVGKAGGPPPVPLAADLRSLPACEQVFADVSKRFGRCDVLVNSAGATRAGSFLDLPDEVWLDGYALKLFACVRLTRLFWPLLKAAEGSVINIGGGAGRTPSADFLIGGSVNAAMGNFSKGLARLGIRDDVNVNVIHPGATLTDRLEDLILQRAQSSGRSVEELRAQELHRAGSRRLGEPEDIAELALFLASPRARHIQGTAIAVDGGTTPGYY
jgi:3-oxoacyl-[acyl-carrier protein] reductase